MQKRHAHNFKDLTGQRFNKLTVIKYAGKKGNGKKKLCHWLCKCDCGNRVVVARNHLANGHTKSCGCYKLKRTSESHTIHGKHGTSEYIVWCNIKNRCYNKKNKSYPRYGKRGIIVCGHWLHSFESFYNDMGNKPSPRHTIERIDNNGNYEPSNCKWVTIKEQCNNRHNNRYITIDNETKTLAQWCRKYDIRYSTVHSRLTLGWSIEKALTMPILHKHSKNKY